MAYTLADAKKHVQQAGTAFHNRMVGAYSKATAGLKQLEGVDSKEGEKIGKQLYNVLRDSLFIEATGNKAGTPAPGSENTPDFIVSTLLGLTEEKFVDTGKKGRIVDYLMLIVQLLEKYKNGPVRNAELQVLPESERKTLASEIEGYIGRKLKPEIAKNLSELSTIWKLYDDARHIGEEDKAKLVLRDQLEKGKALEDIIENEN